MKLTKITYLILAFITLMFACTKEDIVKENTYDKGTFIINQGGFTSSNATISYIGTEDSLVQDIFGLNNNGLSLGSVAQSMASDDVHTYITMNNSSKVVVVDKTTFKLIKEIFGFAQPRYAVVYKDQIYVSQWGETGFNGMIKIIQNNVLIDSIVTGGAPEKMLVDGDKLYVTMSNGFGSDGRLLDIDLKTNKVIKTTTLTIGTNSVIRTNEGDIWALSEGNIDGEKAMLHQLLNNNIVRTIEVGIGASNLTYVANKNSIYFSTYDGVYRMILTDNATIDKIYSTPTYGLYGLAFDSPNNRLLASDAKDFATQGDVTALDFEGNVLKVFKAGLVPGQIVVQ